MFLGCSEQLGSLKKSGHGTVPVAQPFAISLTSSAGQQNRWSSTYQRQGFQRGVLILKDGRVKTVVILGLVSVCWRVGWYKKEAEAELAYEVHDDSGVISPGLSGTDHGKLS